MFTDIKKKSIILVGAGGHGKVVLDALLCLGISPENIFVSDSNKQMQTKTLLGLPIHFQDLEPFILNMSFHIAIGDCLSRERMGVKLLALGGSVMTVMHPSAVVSSTARVDEGVFLAANSIVAPDASVGLGTILNHNCVVDHDCVVGQYSHIAPLASLGGGVSVGNRVLVGAGARILPGIKIEDDAVIGAGAVVSRDVALREIVVGIPAKSVKLSVI